MNNDELQNFENELRKLKPARFNKLPRSFFSVNSACSVVNKKSVFFLTHSVGILLGILFGGGFVHFLQKPVIVEKVVLKTVELQPVTAPAEKPAERIIRSDFTPIPLDIDDMITQYNNRGKLLANLPASRFSSPQSFIAPWTLDDPNSLLNLREQMKL